jgi:predicted TIM-barrel fold metal-dependent hydrolase
VDYDFYVTTSGNFHTQTLLAAMMELGAYRVLFSIDWPFENVSHAAAWFDTCRSARRTTSRRDAPTR